MQDSSIKWLDSPDVEGYYDANILASIILHYALKNSVLFQNLCSYEKQE